MRAERPRGRPPNAIQCALGVVTAGLAVAAVMLTLLGSARSAQAGYLAALPEEGPPSEDIGIAISRVHPAQARPSWARPSPTATPTATPPPTPTPTPTPTSLPPFMPMPVEGTWRVTCGYRCGLHTRVNNATFALDIAPTEGQAVGEPVRSPVDGQIITVVDSSTFLCRGVWTHGPEGGSAIVIDFRDPSNTPWRLRLIHFDAATVGDDLRPDGEPVPVTAGAFLGNLAPLDGCSHLHISLSRLEEDQETPEPLIIEGKLLEDCDGDNCWQGTHLPPEDP